MKKRFMDDYMVRMWLCNVFFLLFGVGLLYIGTKLSSQVIQEILNNIASLFIIAGVYNVISEYFLKKKYLELILSKVKLSNKISDCGLTDIILNINEIQYNDFFNAATQKIDIVHVYAKTWTNNNLEAIKNQLIKHTNVELNLLLLAPDSSVIKSLSETYGGTTSKTIESMEYVAHMWLDMFDEVKGACEFKGKLNLFYHHGQPAYSIYRADNKMICVLNKLSKGRTQQLPTLICEKVEDEKNLFNVFEIEINNLMKTSKKVTRENVGSFYDGLRPEKAKAS